MEHFSLQAAHVSVLASKPIIFRKHLMVDVADFRVFVCA